MSLDKFLKEAQEKIVRLDEARTEVEEVSRKIIRLTKKSIFLTHRESFEEAKSDLEEVSRLVQNLKGFLHEYPEFTGNVFVNTAFQESAEAHLYYNLVRWSKFIDPKEIDVPPSQYLLGLVDCIGELRRRVLDLIRFGRIGEAEKTLEVMDEIFYKLNLNSELQTLVPGLRRKCDIARGIVEATRGDVTLEVRRASLDNSIKRLIDHVSKKE